MILLPRIAVAFGLIALMATVPLAFSSTPVIGGSGFGFTTFELGRFDVSGTLCPGNTATCWNVNGEPQIRADRAGNFYVTSEFLPRTVNCSIALDLVNPQCGGTGAWRSTDNGLHYVTLTSPNALSTGGTGGPQSTLSPYGGDTDVAVGTKRNSNGFFNVYAVSLERATGPLLTVEESTSMYGGQTWSLNPTGATIPVDDRPWVAAEGVNKVCVNYQNTPTNFGLFVTCSEDGGNTFLQTASIFDQSHLTWFGPGNAYKGPLAIDPNNHLIYNVFLSAVGSESDVLPCATLCSNGQHSVWVAVSIDGGKSFTDYLVYNNPDVTASYSHQFPAITLDKAGNIYALYTDNHNTYYSFSTNFGKAWTGPIQINKAPSNTAIFPWGSAGSAGKLDVVWYGTDFFDGTTIPDNYPMSAAWYVYFAQSQNALTSTPTFTQVAATPVIHYGGVCEAGATCAPGSNRDLFDDFGVAASPTTGLASIAFDNDQRTGTTAEPLSPTCTLDQNNKGGCERTDVATQTSGPGIFQKHGGFEIEHEELAVENNDHEHADDRVEMQNTGTTPITSISVTLAGVSLPFAWNSTLPLQPGTTISGTSVVSLQSLLLSAGGVYPVVITATFADGTTVTQTVSVICTLYTLI